MSSMTQWMVGLVVAIVLAFGAYWFAAQQQVANSAPVQPQDQTMQPANQTPSSLGTSPRDTSNGAIDNDTAAIDAQLGALDSDSAGIQDGVQSAQAQ